MVYHIDSCLFCLCDSKVLGDKLNVHTQTNIFVLMENWENSENAPIAVENE